MFKKLLKPFMMRVFILIIPILILFLIGLYASNNQSPHPVNPYLGVAIYSFLWFVIYLFLMLIELAINLKRNKRLWKVNLLLIVLVSTPFLLYIILILMKG